MGPFTSMDVTESGLTAYRLAMDVTASNVANMNSSVAAGGGPYQDEQVVLTSGPSFQTVLGSTIGSVEGVQAVAVTAPPNAAGGQANGAGGATNVDLVQEMANLLSSSQAYDANVSAFSVEKTVEQKALTLGQGV